MEIINFTIENASVIMTLILLILSWILKRFFNIYMTESVRKTLIDIAIGICTQVENHYKYADNIPKEVKSKSKLTMATEKIKDSIPNKLFKYIEPLFGSIQGLIETALTKHIQPALAGKLGTQISVPVTTIQTNDKKEIRKWKKQKNS